ARELFQAMEQVMRGRHPAGSLEDLVAGEGEVMVADFDRAAALERCGDDADLLRELIDMFLTEIRVWMFDLGKAVESGDTEGIKRLAHTIKGAVGTFGARPAYEAAFRLETIGKEGPLGDAAAAFEEMKAVISRLNEALSAYQP